MNGSSTVVLVGMLVLSLLAAGSTVVAQSPGESDPGDGPAIHPGERLSGAIGAENAEFDGEIAERGYGIAIAMAETNESKAAIVAQRLDAIEVRLDELEARNASLAAARQSDELTEGQYRAKVARLEAERNNVERLANRSTAATENVPSAVLSAHGVDRERLQTLTDRANELTGPEVAAIAREIAGPTLGSPPTEQRPDHAGPPDTPGSDERSDQGGDADADEDEDE